MSKVRRKKTRRRRRRYSLIVVFFSVFIIVIAIAGGLYVYAESSKERIKPSITVEAGSDMVDIEEYLLLEDETASYLSVPSSEELKTPGSYPVEIQIDHILYRNEVFTSKLIVEDTTPPTATTRNHTILMPEELQAEDFIESVEDLSEVSISYEKTPDFSIEGDQEVYIRIEDAYNNSTVVTASLHIIKDTAAPVIEGAEDLYVFVGDTISYRAGVTVTDDIDEEPQLEIDNSQVNIQQPGEYIAVYTATDSSGNSSSQEIKVTVRPQTSNAVSEEEVFAIADNVLSDIIEPNMTLEEKTWEIYRWTKRNVSYSGYSLKEDWINEAHHGFKNKHGDCFTYFSVTKALLERAEIPNIDVTRVGGRTDHYWHLVDVGQGWYHLDTTPQRDYLQVFLLTDEEVAAYTARSNRNYYTFDESLYPERGN